MRVARLVVVGLALLTGLTTQAQRVKVQALSAADEQRVLALLKARRTADGATVQDVLKYAETQRKKRFKVASIEVLYGGEKRTSRSVDVCYWIGSKRLRDDQICDISFALSHDRQSLQPDSEGSLQLDKGRSAFLAHLDDTYDQACGPVKPGALPSC